MRHKEDVQGLQGYLKSLSIMPADGELLSMPAFEREQEQRQEVKNDSTSMAP